MSTASSTCNSSSSGSGSRLYGITTYCHCYCYCYCFCFCFCFCFSFCFCFCFSSSSSSSSSSTRPSSSSYSHAYCCPHLRRIDDQRRRQANNISMPGESHGGEIGGEIVSGIGSGIGRRDRSPSGQALASTPLQPLFGTQAARAALSGLSGPGYAAPSKHMSLRSGGRSHGLRRARPFVSCGHASLAWAWRASPRASAHGTGRGRRDHRPQEDAPRSR